MILQDELRMLATSTSLCESYRDVAIDAATKIDELEAENARLKGRVNELAAIVQGCGEAREYAEDDTINLEPEA